jgi:hypothetical protein
VQVISVVGVVIGRDPAPGEPGALELTRDAIEQWSRETQPSGRPAWWSLFTLSHSPPTNA